MISIYHGARSSCMRSNRPMELTGPAHPEVSRGLGRPAPQLIAMVLAGQLRTMTSNLFDIKLGSPNEGWLPFTLTLAGQHWSDEASDAVSDPILELHQLLQDISLAKPIAHKVSMFLEPDWIIFTIETDDTGTMLTCTLTQEDQNRTGDVPNPDVVYRHDVGLTTLYDRLYLALCSWHEVHRSVSAEDWNGGIGTSCYSRILTNVRIRRDQV